MEPEEKIEIEDDSKEFGKVIDALHSKQKLSSLRTYQGDMAEFIKEKNESVISIAVKEKKGKEEAEEKEKLEQPTKKPTSNKDGFQINLTILLLSILLLGGGILASLYIFDFTQKEPLAEVALKTEIIPYNNLITLTNITNKSIGTEFSKLPPSNGITVVKITDSKGASVPKANDLFNFLEFSNISS